MPSIDVYEFISWKGQLLPAQLLVGLVEPAPGVDGYAASVGAWRADPVTITTVCYTDSINEALALRDSFLALAGQAVSCTDQYGETWSSVLVMRALSSYSFSLFNTVRLITAWKLLVDSSPADGS